MKDSWRFSERELTFLQQVLDSGQDGGMAGTATQSFENAFANKAGAKFAITFNSGTSTLHAALHAVGVRSGDEVIMPALTVIANLQVVLAQQAVPVFADIDEVSFNICPTSVRSLVTEKTKAIMIVPLYGAACDFDAFLDLSRETGIPIINDAAQAPFLTHKGQPISSLFDITSFSFDATKHMTTGDGGMITANSESSAQLVRKFGCLGYRDLAADNGRIRVNKDIFQNPEYSRHDDLGLNYRMSEFQAAVGLAQLEKIDAFIQLRSEIASNYYDIVAGSNMLMPQSQHFVPDHSYWTFACRLVAPDVTWVEFRRKFIESGGSGIYAAWRLLYQEELFRSGRWKSHAEDRYENYQLTPCNVAEEIQPQLMQFPLNQRSLSAACSDLDALDATLRYFS